MNMEIKLNGKQVFAIIYGLAVTILLMIVIVCDKGFSGGFLGLVLACIFWSFLLFPLLMVLALAELSRPPIKHDVDMVMLSKKIVDEIEKRYGCEKQ